MNANEVIATLASEQLGEAGAVHPNDQVNASQSSNDVFPTAIHLAATEAIAVDLVPALDHLAKVLRRKAREFAKVVKSGRTHLMDAVPITLGQEMGGYATQCEQAAERLRACLPRLGVLPLGGTAVGTGINAPKGFGGAVVKRLADGHRPAAHRGQGPRRRPVLARRARRGVGSDPHRGRGADQDRQRHPLDGLRSAHRPRRDPPPGPAARARRSCRAR